MALKKEQIPCKWQQLRQREAHKRHTTDAHRVGVGELLQLRIINRSYTDRHRDGTIARARKREGRHHLVYMYTGGIRILNCGFSNEQTPLQKFRKTFCALERPAPECALRVVATKWNKRDHQPCTVATRKMATHAKCDPRTNCNKSSRALSISRHRPHNRTTPFWAHPATGKKQKKNRATIQKWLTSQGIE